MMVFKDVNSDELDQRDDESPLSFTNLSKTQTKLFKSRLFDKELAHKNWGMSRSHHHRIVYKNRNKTK